jgi:hypothetical protein
MAEEKKSIDSNDEQDNSKAKFRNVLNQKNQANRLKGNSKSTPDHKKITEVQGFSTPLFRRKSG